MVCNQLVIAADKLDTAVKRKMMAKLDANKDVMDVNYRGILQKNYDSGSVEGGVGGAHALVRR